MGTQFASAVPQLGELLRYWRRERGKSQLDLSMDTGISQRHLSFVESGRSAPSRDFRLPAGITVGHQPGIAFIFIPERFSRSPRNPIHLAPESALTARGSTMTSSMYRDLKHGLPVEADAIVAILSAAASSMG